MFTSVTVINQQSFLFDRLGVYFFIVDKAVYFYIFGECHKETQCTEKKIYLIVIKIVLISTIFGSRN